MSDDLLARWKDLEQRTAQAELDYWESRADELKAVFTEATAGLILDPTHPMYDFFFQSVAPRNNPPSSSSLRQLLLLVHPDKLKAPDADELVHKAKSLTVDQLGKVLGSENPIMALRDLTVEEKEDSSPSRALGRLKSTFWFLWSSTPQFREIWVSLEALRQKAEALAAENDRLRQRLEGLERL